MRIIFYVTSGIVSYFFLAFLIKKLSKKSALDDDHMGMIGFASFLISCLVAYSVNNYGVCVPGHFFERNEYKKMIYVRLYPYDGDVKSYKVPAMIHANFVECGDEGEECRDYQIEYAVMPNGGKIVFYNPNDTMKIYNGFDPENGLTINEKVSLFDLKEREWGVELTSELAAN